MPPDTTSFIKTLLHSEQWTFTNIVQVLAGLIAVVSTIVVTIKQIIQRKRRRANNVLREKSSDEQLFFDPDEIAIATRYYIPPNCSSVDPMHEAEPRQVIVTEEKLFTMIDKFFKQGTSERHLLLLADSGMGKTSFLINYYVRNQQMPKRKRQRIFIIPLGLREVDKHIETIKNPNSAVLFLDAFDENQEAIQNYSQRLDKLMYLCRSFKRVVITCRTQFFPKDEEIPLKTGISRFGPKKAGEGGVYEFWKLYLMPLNDDQVEQYIRRLYPFWYRDKRKKAREVVKKIRQLAVRPMLLTYIPDVLDENVAKIKYSFQLYEVMVNKWLKREEDWINDKEALRDFSEQLAVKLHLNDTDRIPKAQLAVLAQEWNIPLEEWQLSGRSLLNRDAEGNYKFAHRSIMEYLFVKKLFNGDDKCLAAKRTDQMNIFLLEMTEYETVKKKFISVGYQKADSVSKYPSFLRADPHRNLVKDGDVKPMVTGSERNYFDNYLNKAGKGILHLYLEKKRNGSKVIVDYATNLVWERGGSLALLSFKNVQSHIHSLNTQRYCGYNDWRLPTLDEAMSLMEQDKTAEGLHIDSTFDARQTKIWTADKAGDNKAWVVFFNEGYCNEHPIDLDAYVRAVRGGRALKDLIENQQS